MPWSCREIVLIDYKKLLIFTKHFENFIALILYKLLRQNDAAIREKVENSVSNSNNTSIEQQFKISMGAMAYFQRTTL